MLRYISAYVHPALPSQLPFSSALALPTAFKEEKCFASCPLVKGAEITDFFEIVFY